MKSRKLISSTRGGFWGMSKPVMVGFVAVCLVLAVVLFFVMGTEEKGGYEQLAGQPMWVKCNNPDCNAEYEMDTAEFKGLIAEQKKLNLLYPGDPPVACKECGQLSLLQATKCPKCGNVFFRGELGPTHFKDECPKCGYSEIKERRQQKTGTTE